MKNIWKIFTVFIVTILSTLTVNAINAPENLKILDAWKDYINLWWDASEWALGYYLYYWTKSGINSDYESELYEIIEWEEIQVTWLKPATTYYFSVTSIDEEWSEAGFSNEWVFSTLTSDWETFQSPSLDKLEFVWVFQKSLNTLELTFNSNLDNSVSAVREFRIEEKWNPWNQIKVTSTLLDDNNNKKLIILLWKDTVPYTEYSLTVLRISDTDWKTIESWINSIGLFTGMEEELAWEVIIPVENVIPIEDVVPVVDIALDVIDENNGDLNSAGISWAQLDKDDIVNDTISTAISNQKLPTTGPEHILIFILACILWTLIFVFKFNKRS